MKKTLLLIFLAVSAFTANAQTGICNDFSSANSLSTYPSSGSTVNYSVANNELTITFTNTTAWNNEVKWDFPNSINISGITSPLITYDVKVTSLTITGTGAGCATANFIPLGISLFDNSGYDYSNGSTSSGFFSNTYVSGSNTIDKATSNFDASGVVGISIKAADGGWANCSTPLISGTVVIKNLNIGSASCLTAGINGATNLLTSSAIYPNPTSDNAKVELELKSSSNVKVTLSDVMGKEVMVISEGTVSSLTKEFSVANLNKGIYTVNYFVNGASAKSELLMVK